MIKKARNFGDCYLYGLTNTEGYKVEEKLIGFMRDALRVNVSSPAFEAVKNELKSRINNAVVYRMLQQGNVVLGIAAVELPASYKVFHAKDIASTSHKWKVFVDCTGILVESNGFIICKDIDKLAAYLLGVMVDQVYYTDQNKFVNDGNIQRLSIQAFTKMFAALMDNLRLTGYLNNREKMQYVAGVYFGYSVMGMNIKSAQNTVATVLKLNRQDADGFSYYYDYEADFVNINTLITSMVKTFKLTGMSTDVFVDRWYYIYGKGTMFALELYPSFIKTILYAYSGVYLNRTKRIETVLGRDLIELSNAVIRVGQTMFSRGFKFESATDKEDAQREYDRLMMDFEKTRAERNKSDKEEDDKNVSEASDIMEDYDEDEGYDDFDEYYDDDFFDDDLDSLDEGGGF